MHFYDAIDFHTGCSRGCGSCIPLIAESFRVACVMLPEGEASATGEKGEVRP